jgi:hypothetical protein
MKNLFKVIAGCAMAAPLGLALAAPAGAATPAIATAAVTGSSPVALPVATINASNLYTPAFPGATLKIKFSAPGTCTAATASFVIQNQSSTSQQVTDRVVGNGLVGPPIAAGGALYLCLYKGAHDAQTFSLLSNPFVARLHVVFK